MVNELLWDEQDAVDFVHLDELDLNALVAGGWQVLTDVVGADRQLAVATIGEHGELHAVGPAVAEQGLDRGADRAARVEDVVDEDDGHALDRKVQRGRADERLGVLGRLAAPDVDVVAVEGDVQLPEGDVGAADLRDPPPESLGERDAARVDPDECDSRQVRVAFDDLVRDPGQGALDRLGVEQNFRCGGKSAYCALRALLTFDSFPASLDRVKGVCCRCGTLVAPPDVTDRR
jgi:hypothetical protein